MANGVYNDQDLALLINSGVSPNLRDDQELAIIVQQRLVPALISLDVDQELVIVVAGRNSEVKGYFRKDYWLFQANGPVISNAEVWVCNQPLIPSGGYTVTTQRGVTTTTGSVPSPLATLFADPNGLSLLAQPLVPDAYGHVSFYVQGHAKGTNTTPTDFYTVVSYTTVGSRSNQLQAQLFQTLPDQYVGYSLLNG